MKTKRIIYGAPPSNTPAGGVKVIYQHSELLNELGIESAIWHPNDESFQCTWFANDIKKIKLSEMNPETDIIVIPEIWASTHVKMLKNAGFKVVIYVQNCYYTHVNLDPDNKNAIYEAYNMAEIILSISEDTSRYLIEVLNVPQDKILIQRYSINHQIFTPKNKKKIITYMPRKMADHSTRVVHALAGLLPPDQWIIQPIHNMNELQVAEALSESIIFLAFSEFEGLPVPPVEAALCGNFVIGYDGQGGQEYWNSPNFQKVEQGNIQEFIKKVILQTKIIDSEIIKLDEVNDGIKILSDRFSKEKEKEFITEFYKKAIAINLKISN